MIEDKILEQNLNDSVPYSEFFGALGYAPGDIIRVRMFKDKDKKGDKGKKYPVRLEDFDANIPALRSYNQQNRGVYFVVNGGGDRKEEVLAAGGPARAQFVEIDPEKEDEERLKTGEVAADDLLKGQLETLRRFPLEPSIMIRTWKSIHCYWILRDGQITRFRSIQGRLVKTFNSDSSIIDESRVMRIPGFYHMKYDPVMVRLIKFSPELTYTQDELEAALDQMAAEYPPEPAEDQNRQAESAANDAPLSPEQLLERDLAADSVREFLNSHNIEILAEKETPEQSYCFAVRCPWEDQHTTESGLWDSAILVYRSGIIRYYCYHSHCRGRTWTQYKQYYADAAAAAGNLKQFHLHNKNKVPTGVFDWAIYEYICRTQSLFICGGTPYIYDSGVYRPDMSGAELKTRIRKLIYPQFIKATTIRRVYELFTGAAELQKSPEDLNQYPAHWINFQNGFYDPLQRRMVPHDPRYLAINQIPHSYDPGAAPAGQLVQNWLREICPAADDREMLLQFCGYSLTRDTRQQKFMILSGPGGTGKSTVIRMMEAAIGTENTSNISLSQLAQRFYPFGLLGKLLNSCADLEVGALEDVSTLKKILGEDALIGERKGRDGVSFRNYAKLVFSTNELPTIRAERTTGFYRRLLVLQMDKVPENRRTDFYDSLAGEMDAFIHAAVAALERMLLFGEIKESERSRQAVQQLRNDSDTVEAFLREICERDPRARVKRTDLWQRYSVFCYENGRQSLARNNFIRSMRVKGYSEAKHSGEWFFTGVKIQESALKVPQKNAPAPSPQQSP